MKESVSTKPAIFAMSSPTMNAECIAIDAFKHAGGDIVFRSGSPFENVDLGNGKVGHVNQANNMYLFLGIGLGSLLSGARLITDGMLQAAAEWYRMHPEICKSSSLHFDNNKAQNRSQ
ncbi:NAD-dependent malic enzyme 2, mitochondrial-like isoform X2 [Arachis ipaensis]|uniref:NAD-dependent malic enzyme 2, mitochondrial-like isoform X2 n=1 Tax=Arachis ipaensis TaxID=130454 RepID=UPI000A2B63B5|nr:NAD-dependent malic enzyme 2, mitochondrial-like isoform X2 [Arachis ipaensis]